MYPNSPKQLVTEELVYNVLSTTGDSRRSNVGDIFSRYIVPIIELDDVPIVHDN